jgi:hypothetical protein
VTARRDLWGPAVIITAPSERDTNNTNNTFHHAYDESILFEQSMFAIKEKEEDTSSAFVT